MVGSESLSQRLSQLSAADKQRLLAHLLQEKTRRQPPPPPGELDDWVGETTLPDDIRPVGPARFPRQPRNILLTGATGFLGAHLLHDLCVHTDAVVWCLVRSDDEREAVRRLETNFARYHRTPLDFTRIRPLPGDLTRPQLGLPGAAYARLAQQVDVIVHNAARLHHLAPYDQLKADNVGSTVAMLRLATTATPKWVQYVSTLVAAVDRDEAGQLVEDFPRGDPKDLAGGYAQSKWVAEKLLTEAVRRGVGVTVFRPGFISGRSDSGAWPPDQDHLLRVIKGCLQLGCAPHSELTPNMAPVDFVSAAIVRIGFGGGDAAGVFNLCNPHQPSWETLMGWLQASGYDLRIVPNLAWREQHLAGLSKDNALFPVLPLYLGGVTTERHAALLLKLAKVRNERTAAALMRLNLPFPRIDEALWRRYLAHLQRCGFLDAPG